MTTGPLSPYFRLSKPGRQLFVTLLLPLAAADPAVTWRHTRSTEYPEVEAESPARWLIREAGEIPTSLGPRPIARCVDSELAAWPRILPVAPVDCAFLGLPRELPTLPADILREAYALALNDDDLPAVPRVLRRIGAGASVRADANPRRRANRAVSAAARRSDRDQ